MILKFRHVLTSKNENSITFPVDYLAEIAGIEAKENKFRKLSLKRDLDNIRSKVGPVFEYKFTNNGEKFTEDYFVEMIFPLTDELKSLRETSAEKFFHKQLITNLKLAFNSLYPNIIIENEKDHFQRWCTNKRKDMDIKAKIYCDAWNAAYNEKISIYDALTRINSSF